MLKCEQIRQRGYVEESDQQSEGEWGNKILNQEDGIWTWGKEMDHNWEREKEKEKTKSELNNEQKNKNIKKRLTSKHSLNPLSSLLPPRIFHPFQHLHAPLIPCNHGCCIVGFMESWNQGYQVIYHNQHHRFFPTNKQINNRQYLIGIRNRSGNGGNDGEGQIWRTPIGDFVELGNNQDQDASDDELRTQYQIDEQSQEERDKEFEEDQDDESETSDDDDEDEDETSS
ncbi:MAG: hypothetical protein EZS28_005174 [Streblomastix strix]|uniref:Uncharacterized protein n=1 Tax=Streblomastix strix TaxID=222440 RepID=A0A5J4WWL1_9EUKA|nr:MAG: hypothetical protein EZS28_005174 [Streblomastix strix]